MFRQFANHRPSILVGIGLVAITAVGTAMRLYGLSTQSLWFDEVCSWHTATHPTLAGVWSGDLQWNMYPPLYGFILRATIALFGSAEWALRLPSALSAAAAIPLMYLVAARIYGDAEGLVSAGLTAFSVFTLYFAQEARPYALLLFFLLLTVLTWSYNCEAWRGGGTAPRWSILVCFVASLCTAYFHYFGLMFITLQGIATFALLARTRPGLVRAIVFYAATAIAYTPWLPFMWRHLRNQSDGPQNPPIEANVFVSFWHYVGSLFNHGQAASSLASVLTGVAILLIGFAIARELIRQNSADARTDSLRNRAARTALVAAWIFIPFLIAYGKSSVSASIFTHRNLTIALPAVYLLVSRGITQLPIPRRATAAIGAAIVIGLCARTMSSGYYTNTHKDQFREVVDTVENQRAQYPNPAIVVYAHLPFAFDYYLQRLEPPLVPALVAGKASQIDSMRALVRDRKPGAVWYLCTEPYPENAFVDYLNAEFRVIGVGEFLRANAMLLVPK